MLHIEDISAKLMKKLLEYYKHCDAFYTAYQACFDDDFAWGQRTSHYYYTR